MTTPFLQLVVNTIRMFRPMLGEYHNIMIVIGFGFDKVIYKMVQFCPPKKFLNFLHQARALTLKEIDIGFHKPDISFYF